ncbi:hypothetical protein Tco_1148853 [Tanacetum coccineum]
MKWESMKTIEIRCFMSWNKSVWKKKSGSGSVRALPKQLLLIQKQNLDIYVLRLRDSVVYTYEEGLCRLSVENMKFLKTNSVVIAVNLLIAVTAYDLRSHPTHCFSRNASKKEADQKSYDIGDRIWHDNIGSHLARQYWTKSGSS